MLRSNRSRSLIRFSVVGLAAGAFATLAACSSTPDSTSTAQDDLNAASPDTTGDVTLAEVRAAIKASGAKWTADNTSYSALPRAARKQMLGVPNMPTARALIVEDDPQLAAAAATLPAAYDWRNVNGKNFVSPILDQGRCGSCVAFSTVGTLETQLNIASGDITTPWEMSPQYIFSCGGGACNAGWDVDSAASFLKSTGDVDDACMPYGSGPLGTDVACSKACSDHATRAIKTTGYTTPTSGSINVTAVKTALLQGPLVATMNVYADFEYYTTGVYKHVTGAMEGGHAVSIVGYSNADSAWIVRNSWATSWGENGFFEIAWSDTASGVGAETWLLQVATPGAHVDLANVHDKAVLSGTEALTVDASTGVTGVAWSLTASGATKAAASGTSADGKTASIDTTKVADGVYTLVTTGTASGKAIKSQPRTVYILNGAETGSITIPIKSGQTVTGESLFNATVKASPVPLTNVIWTVSDSTGKVFLSHSTNDAGTTMQLFWGTTLVPNGSYTLTVTGYAGTKTLPSTSVPIVVKN